MELNTNTTSQASHAPDGAQPQGFNWQNPSFPMPSPRARPSGSNRVPGIVYSHRPRWTPGKHARILADIKATRTDLDPSFPRPATAANAGQPTDAYPLSEVISNFVQGTKSYFDGLTAYALEQLYGPVSSPAPAAGASTGPKDPEAQRKEFLHALVQGGISKDMATNIVVAWTANGVPLNLHAAPTIYNPEFEFLPEDKLKSYSGALLVYYKTGRGDNLVVKCYPPAAEVDLRRFSEMTGIDPHVPKLEARCLLASHIAHNILGWDILPKASMGFFSGKACVVTPRINGISLKDGLENSLTLSQSFLGVMRGGVVHTEEWGVGFSEQFKHDYIRLLVFTVLVGDYDRHFAQFIIDVDNKGLSSIKAIDWDASFGSQKTDDMLYINLATGEPSSLWPSSIPQTICNEFNKVTEANLIEAAAVFELTEEEVAAMLSRLQLIKKKLAVIKKT